MFDPAPTYGSPPEVIARFDELFERRHPSRTMESVALLQSWAPAYSWSPQSHRHHGPFKSASSSYNFQDTGALVGSSTDNRPKRNETGVGVTTFWWLLAWAANFGLYCAVRIRFAKARRNLLRLSSRG